MPRVRFLASLLPVLVSLAASGPPGLAQQQSNAGLGTIKRFVNATAQSNPRDVFISGIAYVNGKSYVGSAPTATTGTIYELTNGKRTNQFSTPLGPTGGSFDMDTDGRVIFAATSAGVVVFDTAGKTTNLSIRTKNGLKPLARNPIPTSVFGLHAVAYDPSGNNGNGSLFLGIQSTTAPIVEVDMTGRQLASFPNLGWSAAGLTVDPRTGNLWCMAAANGTDIIELDRRNKLKPTGSRFAQGNQWALRCCGGICGIPGGDVRTYKSDFDIAALTRLPGDDYVYIHRVHLFPGLLGFDEAGIVGGVNTANLGRGLAGDGNLGVIKAADTLSWALRPGRSGRKNQPAIVTMSLGPDASVDGLNFGGLLLPEWRILSPFSLPPSFTMLFLPPSLVGGPTASVRLPPGILRCFELIRLQAIVIEPAPQPVKFVASNEIWAHVSDEKKCSILVEAVGTNSLNTDTTKGFWRVIHKGGLPPIKEVTFDWTTTRDPAQTTMRFDTDQANIADFFDAGNSTTIGCKGTYRNGSDVKTGLIYDNRNHRINSCASAGANSGFIATNAINAVNDFRTLTFRFQAVKFLGSPTKPKVFEFDCDTDGGKGVDGASMAGCVIKITFLTRKVVMGELRVDPTSSISRSVAGF